jgi:hypothetical protein
LNLRSFYADAISHALQADPEKALLSGFDEARKADTNPHVRDAAYTVAWAVFGDLPGNPLHGNERAWDSVLRMFDRMTDWMDEDGAWTWYIPATRKTHQHDYAWVAFC